MTGLDSAGPARPAAMGDWRLLPAALTVWLAGLLGLLVAWWCALVVGAVGGMVGALAVRVARGAPGGRAYRGVGWSLMACAVLAAVPIGLRVRASEQDPLRDHAARGAAAHLRVVVADRPRPVFTTGFGGQPSGVRFVVIPAEAREVWVATPVGVVPENAVASHGEVLVIAPADAWAGLLPGQEAMADGTLAPARPDQLTVALLRVRGPPGEISPAPAWHRAAESVRAGLRRVTGVLSEEPAGLLPALVVGDTSALPRRVVDEFRVAGMSHLLAVSGANLAIVCAAVLLLLRVVRVGPRASALGAMLALLGFVLLAGPEPSVLRAGVMGAVALLALALGRTHAAVPALAVAVIGLILHDPGMAVNFGFVLSVLATGALVLLAPRWALALADRGVPLGLAQALAVPAAAHLVTAPVVAGMTGQVSVVAVVANLVVAPVVAPATVLGLLAALVAAPAPWLAEFLVLLAGPEVSWLIIVGRQAAGMPLAAIAWPSGWLGGLLLLLGMAVVGAMLANRRLRGLTVAVLVGVLVAVVPMRVISPSWPPVGWSAVSCDVGQGDAIVLATAEPERAVLIDTGPEPSAVAECLGRLGISRLSLVVLSHLHADHVGGLSAVLSEYPVGAVAVGSARLPQWAWREVQSDADSAGVPVVWLAKGQRLEWPGLVIDVLGPRYVDPRTDGEATGTEINNGSLVLRASTPSGRLLLTGDAELAAQADLLNSAVDLSADVLKVPHHGSRYTAPEFLDAVRPRVALISVGAGNDFGHPSPLITERLRAAGTLVLRTDQDGDSAVVPDARGPLVVRRGEPRAPPH